MDTDTTSDDNNDINKDIKDKNYTNNRIFNMKILVDVRDVGWKKDYSDILNYFSKFPHIKIDENNENGHWNGVALCSTDFNAGLRPANKIGNQNETDHTNKNSSSIALSQCVLEQ